MCGIAGYVGPKQAESILLVALERLKYRGYDSAGMAISNGDDIQVRKSSGRLLQLEAQLKDRGIGGTTGIAHTRWATHGAPTTDNSHPHTNNEGTIAVVHNGIIENHEQLRQELEAEGAIFRSQTDTEVIPHLVDKYYSGDPLEAVQKARKRLIGSYAFAVIFQDFHGRIIASRQGSPLLAGRGHGQCLLASDVPALLPHAEDVCYLEDGWTVDMSANQMTIFDNAGDQVNAPFETIELEVSAVSKGDYDSFMAKEIAEQPKVLRDLLASRLNGDRLVETDMGKIDLTNINHIVFLACGTSWHAALLGKRFLEHYARVHVEVDISSEYRYRNPVASGGTLVVAISQSGETADTLASVRLARSKFIPVVSLVNVVDSTIARESDGVLPLMAGPEIGVASTKAYTAQVLALYLFALQVARAKGRLDSDAEAQCLRAAKSIPDQVESSLAQCEDAVQDAMDIFAPAHATIFLGRGGEAVTALEGALKLKEIAYVHAAGYPAGEFKHGPIALVSQSLPVICICPRDDLYEKMKSNVEEVQARAGRIIVVGTEGDHELEALADHFFPVSKAVDPLLQPLLTILPLQRYSYHVAQRRDCDVDQPRNLAKSVTVE